MNLIGEIKVRLFAVDDILVNKAELPAQIVRECCHLQLRFCCETLALACLVAHGDIPGANSAKMRARYEPGWIMKRLEALHPSFFPVPGEMVDLPPDGSEFKEAPAHLRPLSKDELARIWDQLGDKLHRGNLHNLLDPDRQPKLEHFLAIQEWRDKFRDLLDQHRVGSISNTIHYVCLSAMRSREERGLIITTSADPYDPFAHNAPVS